MITKSEKHARRKFVEAVKVNPEDAEAVKMVTRLDALFAIDRAAKEQGLSPEERQQLRLDHSGEWLTELHLQLNILRREALPASALGQAVSYTLNHWPKLAKYLQHPVIELSNNIAENSMRPVALGRKNWLHIGSESAGPKVAAILTAVESCRRLKLPVRAYLADVLPRLASVKVSEAASLTPARWAASRQGLV